MAKKFYVVWVGRETGIFTSWPETHKLIDKYPKARYKSFASQQEAEAAFAQGPSSASATSNKPKKTTATVSIIDPDCDVHIYCDGGCDPNPGKSGSGVAVYQSQTLTALWYGLYHPNGTNNTAELNALYQSLLIAEQALQQGKSTQILCDSKYAIDCVTQWAFSWKARGWTKKTGEIKNLAIIQKAHERFVKIRDHVAVTHVKAHIGIEGNELADRMSIYAIDQQNPEFNRYPEPIDIQAILALRAG